MVSTPLFKQGPAVPCALKCFTTFLPRLGRHPPLCLSVLLP